MGTPFTEANLSPFGYERQQFLGRGQYATVSVVADKNGALHVAKTVPASFPSRLSVGCQSSFVWTLKVLLIAVPMCREFV